MMRWLKQRDLLRKFTPDGRSCEQCVFVDIHAKGIPVRYTCELDGDLVDPEAYCEAFFDWYEVADSDLPASAHEKAQILATKMATYQSPTFTIGLA